MWRLSLVLVVAAVPLAAQELRRQIESGPDGAVLLRYGSGADVCGNATTLRIGGPDEWGEGTSVWVRSDGWSGASCDRGLASALVLRSEGKVTSVRVWIGETTPRRAVQDLGRVAAPAAARALLAIALDADGRVGREALLAAIVADSSELGRPLLALARSRTHSRGLREAATGWLGRELSLADRVISAELARALGELASDRDAPESVRARGVTALARGGEAAIGQLVALAASDAPATAKAAIVGLARVGTPAARRAVRDVAERPTISDPAKLEAVKVLGNRDATPADLALLRSWWPKLTSDPIRGGVVEALGEAGGEENARWLVGLVRDRSVPVAQRTQAARVVERAGVGSAELVRLYQQETERPVKEALLEALTKVADRTAAEAITTIAERDTDPNLRRAAVRWLSRSGGESGRDLLRAMVER